jgi:hypothetical protein
MLDKAVSTARRVASNQARKVKGLALCERCNLRPAVDMHHIDENPLNNAPDNLLGLCRACHMDVHYPERGMRRAVARASSLSRSWQDRTAAPAQFELALHMLQISQSGAARFLDVTPRQVARYIDGSRKIPLPTMMLLRLMIATRRRPVVPPTKTGQRRR